MSDTAIQVFKGSKFPYTKVAKRGNDVLGIFVVYGPTSQGGSFVVRFVAHGASAYDFNAKFDHFTPREPNEFTYTDGQHFKGFKLNMVQVPVFQPYVPPYLFVNVADKYEIWEILADWIAEQAKADGFELVMSTAELAQLIRKQFTMDEDLDKFKLILDFPDFKEEKKSSKYSVPFVQEEEEEDEDEDNSESV